MHIKWVLIKISSPLFFYASTTPVMCAFECVNACLCMLPWLWVWFIMFMVPFNLSCVWLCWWGYGGAGAIYHTAPNALILCSWSSEGSSINIRLTEPLPHPLSQTRLPQEPSVNIWASFFHQCPKFHTITPSYESKQAG